MSGSPQTFLRAWHERQVDIIDHAGVNLGPTWAIFRFRVQGIGATVAEDLANEMNSVPGVIRVFRPGEMIPPMLVNTLPRLDPVRSLLAKITEPPYLCNSQDILDDAYFYGRESELRELSAAMETCRRTKHQGLIVFVTGPLKFGKTSLVNRFIRETRVQDPACAVARAQCPFGRGWEATEKALLKNLAEEVCAHADRKAVIVPAESLVSIPALSEFFQRKLGRLLFLFIDEAIRMFFATTDKEQKAALTDFLGWVLNTQGVFLVLAGPKASQRYLDHDYRDILDKTTRVDVKPLDSKDTLSLLLAENLGVRHIDIQAKSSHADFLVKATGGNPFWTNLIASTAWEGSRRQRPFVLRAGLLREAMTRALDERENSFEDRLFDRLWDKRSTLIARTVLLTLAGLGPNELVDRTGAVPFSLLYSSSALSSLAVTHRELSDVLADLQDRGTIQQPKVPGAEPAYEFSASVLRDFVRRRQDYADALWQQALRRS